MNETTQNSIPRLVKASEIEAMPETAKVHILNPLEIEAELWYSQPNNK
jgi:hypothetical protein